MADLINQILAGANLGTIGIVFYLFVGGRLHSDREFNQMQADRDMERIAHGHTLEALRLANMRADTGAMTAQIVAQALGGPHVLDRGGSHAPPPG